MSILSNQPFPRQNCRHRMLCQTAKSGKLLRDLVGSSSVAKPPAILVRKAPDDRQLRIKRLGIFCQ